MTCVAWDGVTIAVDSLCVFENIKTHTDKLFKITEKGSKEVKEVIAICGNLDVCMSMFGLYERGVIDPAEYLPQNADNESFLVIANREGVSWMCEGGYPVKVNDKFFALGSGAGLALAAMHCGKSAVEAVEIACMYDINCGGKILFHSFIGAVEKKGGKK